MFTKVSNFQLMVAGIFGALAIAGLIAFATFSSGSDKIAEVSIWSDIDSSILEQWLKDVDSDSFRVSYRYIPRDEFTQTLIEELSLGRRPDILLTNVGRQFELGERLQTIPQKSLSLTDFRERYVSGAESAYVTANGYVGLPLFVDPLILYSNRRLLDVNGIATPPNYWDEASTMTRRYAKTLGRVVNQTMIPIGTYNSTNHAKDIITGMLGQVGVVPFKLTDQGYVSDLTGPDVISVISYYTDFADPASAVYNWNDSQNNSRDAFVAEESLLYLGKSSDYSEIVALNPNLDVQVSEFPQIRNNLKTTQADFYGLLFPRGTDIATNFEYLAEILASELYNQVATDIGMSPANRSSLSVESDNELTAVSARSALYARSWPDIDSRETDQIFNQMIDNILYRGIDVPTAIVTAQRELYEISR